MKQLNFFDKLNVENQNDRGIRSMFIFCVSWEILEHLLIVVIFQLSIHQPDLSLVKA